jgi:hypothetical protein
MREQRFWKVSGWEQRQGQYSNGHDYPIDQEKGGGGTQQTMPRMAR